MTGDYLDRAHALLADATVCDITLPWEPGYVDDDVTLPRFHAAHVDFISLTVHDDDGRMVGTMRHMATVLSALRARSDSIVLVTTVAGLRRAKREGKLAVGFNFQETNPLEGSIDMLHAYYALGMRQMLLAYNRKNDVGDGCAERTDAGLSRFGVRVVEEMNRLGILVDGSHSGHATTMEAMDVAIKPFIFSHSNAYALVPHFRNIRDDQIKACAATGGVIGINGVGAFLDDVEARTETVFRHVDYVAQLVGPQHVALGLDYVRDVDRVWAWVGANPEMWPSDGVPTRPSKFMQPEQIVELAALMLEHGYSDDDVRGIAGENYLRVAEQVWDAATP